MKFLADMGISPNTVKALRNLGYDAVHLAEQKLHRLPDNEILLKARTESRVILTVDLDFAQLTAASGEQLPSVILFRLGNASREVIEARLLEILDQCADTLELGAIISVRDEFFRVRKLPI